jgi:hypothetical protein
MERLHVRQRLDEWSYRILGPTTVHLQFEFFLLISLTLLTISSLQGLYKESFGLPGDYIFVSLVFLCLSRHVIFRHICTWDKSTHASPSLLGFLSHFFTAHLTGGQVYDRPPAPVLARLVGSSYNEDGGSISWCGLLPSSVIYAWQLLRVRIWLPLEQRRRREERRSGSRRRRYGNYSQRASTSSNTEPHDWLQRSFTSAVKAVHSAWMSYGPTLQFILPLLAVALVVAGLGLYHTQYFVSSPSRRTPDDIDWNLLAMDPRSRDAMKVSPEADRRRGIYRHKTQPTWGAIFLEMMVVGECLSLLFFLRVLLPLPDLVAGNNVVNDVRQDFPTGSSGGGSGARSSSKTSSKAKDNLQLQQHQHESPWTERIRPIVTTPRLRLHICVTLVRLAENLFLCCILPRTLYICRATGHCPAGTPLWELSRIIFPVGVSSPYREDGLPFFGFMEWDGPSAAWTVVCVMSVTTVLLAAHALVMNKAYLAILGYLACEWKLLGLSELQELASTPIPGTWDPRKKYKEGDLVAYMSGRKTMIYRSTSDSPEGKPMNLAVFHDSLQSELGHPATSRTLSRLASIQLCVTVAITFLTACLGMLGYSSHGTYLALLANLVALHALVTVGETNYGELERLNDEIKASVAA